MRGSPWCKKVEKVDRKLLFFGSFSREEKACRRPASDGFSFLVASVYVDDMKALAAGRLLVIARGASEDVSFFSIFVEKRVKLSLASSVGVPLGGSFHSLGPQACVARALGSMIDSFSYNNIWFRVTFILFIYELNTLGWKDLFFALIILCNLLLCIIIYRIGLL